MKQKLVLAAMALFLLALWGLWPRAAILEGAATSGAAAAPSAAPRQAASWHTGGGAGDVNRLLAPSLRGTQMDGEINTGPGGHLVLSLGLRRLFDYFLAASGEVPDAAIEARIAAVINRSVHDPAASEARDVLHRYLEWRKYAAAHMNADSDLAAGAGLPERFAQLKATRRRFFSGAEIEVFWGEEERSTDAAVLRYEAQNNSDLDAAARAQKLAEAESMRPSATKRSEQAATQALRQMDEEAQLRQAGASEAEIHAARVQGAGAEAAARLAAMDQERNHWQSRVEDFLKARHSILTNPALSAHEQAAAVDSLRAQRFEGTEQLRIRTFEESGRSEIPEISDTRDTTDTADTPETADTESEAP